jgi:hypothetical protein
LQYHQNIQGSSHRPNGNGTRADDETDHAQSSVSSVVVDDTLTGIGELDNPTRELFADVFAKFQPTDQDAATMVCISLEWRLAINIKT